jgi:outer membrane protein TolC
MLPIRRKTRQLAIGGLILFNLAVAYHADAQSGPQAPPPLEEVENALTTYAEEQVRRSHLKKAVAAARRAADLARDRYAAGLVDFSHVLDAQRSLLSFQGALARSEGTVTTNLISLYKALGGGWEQQR